MELRFMFSTHSASFSHLSHLFYREWYVLSPHEVEHMGNSRVTKQIMKVNKVKPCWDSSTE